MVSGNLPVWVILLVPLAFWASKSLQMASPGTAEPTSKHVPEQLPIQTFQTVLLKRLGLQRRPDPKPKLLVPQYLLDLYRFSSRQLPASPKDTEQPFLRGRAATANTVRTFHHVGETLAQFPTLTGLREERGEKVWISLGTADQRLRWWQESAHIKLSGKKSRGAESHKHHKPMGLLTWDGLSSMDRAQVGMLKIPGANHQLSPGQKL